MSGTTTTNLPKLKSSEMMAFATSLNDKMEAFVKANGLELTPKVKERLTNGAREAFVVLKSKGVSPYQLDVNNLMAVFQSVAFLPLNPNAYPQQAYFSTRSGGKGNPLILEYNVQGDGWETLLNVYGKDLITFKSVVIREGDYFSGIEYVGFEQKPPHIKLLNNDGIVEKKLHSKIRKVKQLVYMIRTTYGDQYHVVNREDIKSNILAQAKNNGATPELVREMSVLSVDDILDPNGKYLDMMIKNQWGNNVNLLSPSYRDESSREGMIITKMKKYFCNKYSKDFNKDPENKNRGELLQRMYQNTLQEDNYVIEAKGTEETIENSKQEFVENANKEELENETTQREDYEVKEDELEKDDLEDLEEENLEEPTQEETTQKDDDETVEEEVIEEPKNNMPEWM
jgi:hypothetical protein